MEDGQAELSEEELERRRAERAPVEEAGGGESEGFEQAEEELVERVEGDKGHGHPLGDRFAPEQTDPREHTAFGDADEIPSDARDFDRESDNPPVEPPDAE